MASINITYVVWKIISEHLLYKNFRGKYAIHLMHSSPLEEEWFSQFFSILFRFILLCFHLASKAEEDGLAHILYSDCTSTITNVKKTERSPEESVF